MAIPLLKTKLYIPPVRPELVSRPRLIERLNAGLHRKLTLISAPAGFGKTTLLSEWIAGRERPVAWVSLDEGDNDPARFLAYFVAALQTLALSQIEGIEPDIGAGALDALQSPQPLPTESVLTALINEIAAIPDRIVLVLDDYHLIEARSIHNALTFLLRHLPPQMHLVIATREDPHLPLARLRARGQLTELRAADLRFSSSEAAEFLNQVMGLDLSAEDTAALETCTEGWIAGLQLAALSMQGSKDVTGFIKSFTGSHHFVLDYLVEEVLQQQPESVQTFLLQTAVLDRLIGSLCDALTGQDNGRETLEMLEHANLFIVPLDEQRRWYRYHHLFADLLRQRLRQTQPEQVSTLHQQAREWYEQNGFADEAIEHALRAKDYERAAHLINKLAETLWACGEHITLWRWLEALPDELVRSWPRLCTFHAWMLFVNGKLQAAEQSLKAAEQALDSMGGGVIEAAADGPNIARQRGIVAAIRAYIASLQSDTPGIIQFSHQALGYFSEEDSTWRCSVAIVLGDSHFWSGDMVAANRAYSEAMMVSKAAGNIFHIMLASLRVAKVERLQGRLRRVTELCRHLSQLAEESGISQTATAGWSFAMWGEVLYEWNDLDKAERFVEKCIKSSEQEHNVGVLGWGYLVLVRILCGQGDLAGALGIIQKMERIAEIRAITWYTNRMAAWKARIWVAQGNGDPSRLEAAAQLLQERGLNQGDEISYLREAEYLSLARLLIAQCKLEEATRLLQRLLEAAETGERTSRVIEILLLQALAFQAGGDTARAMTPLEQALTLAELEGFIRVFVDEGPPMARLLYEAATRGIAPDYARRLLAAFPIAEPEQPGLSKTQAPKPELVEPLSERELEVLQLIAEGLTNPEIASRLFLSLHTIKVHARNIYGKLGVRNRTQAVTRARALGVLPPT